MARLTIDDIFQLAQLAKLELSKGEAEQFKKEITEILRYVEQLQSVDTGELEPTYQVTGLKNVMREDTIKDYGTSQQNLLNNVPAVENGHVKVKRVLE